MRDAAQITLKLVEAPCSLEQPIENHELPAPRDQGERELGRTVKFLGCVHGILKDRTCWMIVRHYISGQKQKHNALMFRNPKQPGRNKM